MIKKIILSGFTLLLLGGCNPEMGRLPLESDVGCLRKELSSDMHLSFQTATNFCQKSDHGVPLPLNLKGALDLQVQAEQANIAYIN
ncbi:unnamed protein product [Commensalibacter communis]|uniref:Lipoprotein n=1 Tax=Commensalibacter communis TaxID=2972786 RepID=A0A9W4XGM7_9PROT|nr:unnamed protein product [Commensalibacter communis]CAI3922228.1 unnamed protein product [Commensalibacter communis]CAI3922272.1 unnamed protein product [Commensalibacter communis]CAI3922359.1 unnamed protein product [Commensalibacter communis]CAI3922811.1 unnamed protein product [Commensalibacter communis]